jgi:hypothetical protein
VKLPVGTFFVDGLHHQVLREGIVRTRLFDSVLPLKKFLNYFLSREVLWRRAVEVCAAIGAIRLRPGTREQRGEQKQQEQKKLSSWAHKLLFEKDVSRKYTRTSGRCKFKATVEQEFRMAPLSVQRIAWLLKSCA